MEDGDEGQTAFLFDFGAKFIEKLAVSILIKNDVNLFFLQNIRQSGDVLFRIVCIIGQKELGGR